MFVNRALFFCISLCCLAGRNGMGWNGMVVICNFTLVSCINPVASNRIASHHIEYGPLTNTLNAKRGSAKKLGVAENAESHRKEQVKLSGGGVRWGGGEGFYWRNCNNQATEGDQFAPFFTQIKRGIKNSKLCRQLLNCFNFYEAFFPRTNIFFCFTISVWSCFYLPDLARKRGIGKNSFLNWKKNCISLEVPPLVSSTSWKKKSEVVEILSSVKGKMVLRSWKIQRVVKVESETGPWRLCGAAAMHTTQKIFPLLLGGKKTLRLSP